MVFDEIICASDDEKFMLEALKEAARAAEEGEVPVAPKRARCPSAPLL